MADLEFHIQTPRLVLSHLQSDNDEHCDFLVKLYEGERAVAKDNVARVTSDRQSARDGIKSDDRTYTSGYGRYLVSLKPPTSSTKEELQAPFSERVKSYTMIGVTTLKLRKFEGSPLAPDVGYGLLPAFQGKGYATEAAGGLVKWFEKEKGQREFFGFCNPVNEGSKGVLRRLGFEQRGVKDVKGLKPDGDVITCMVFSKGLTRSLEEYGLK